MQIEVATTEDAQVVALAGRFDYTTRASFMARMEEVVAREAAREIRLDCGEVDYIDSSALGMLLMLRDKARKHGKTIVLANLQGSVRSVIDTAQFERLFPIV